MKGNLRSGVLRSFSRHLRSGGTRSVTLSDTAGFPPGTPVHVGERKEEETRITVMDFDEKGIEALEVKGVEECLSRKSTPTTTWINVDGLHEVPLIEEVGRGFGIHPLVVEDIVNTHQRPKVEFFQDHAFIVVKMVSYDEETGGLEVEQVSMVLGAHYVLTFQERQGDIFDPLRERIRQNKGRVRRAGCDYLAYAMLDAIVDGLFIVIERIGDHIEMIEEELVANAEPGLLQKIHTLKSQMIVLRRSVWPFREIINELQRGDSALIHVSTQLYLRDLYDHTIQVMDTIETQRDLIAGMLEVYLSSISNRMNQVMKVLTIFASIFIPLTFIAGVYGMNFEHMPELGLRWGYFAVLALMGAIGVSMLVYFKVRRWF